MKLGENGTLADINHVGLPDLIFNSYSNSKLINGVYYPSVGWLAAYNSGNKFENPVLLKQDLSYNYNNNKTGRLTSLEKTLDGTAYKFVWTYNAMDKIKSITYPNLKTVNFTYNNAGLPQSADQFVTSASYNAASQPMTMTYANSLVTRFDYYPENLRRKSVMSGALQNLNYEYDGIGNIIKINDTVHSNIRNYSYDDLNRMLAGDSSVYEYNAIGNIIKADTVEQKYSLFLPHALINDGTNIFLYDACGNMLSGAGRSITYDAENRPVSISKDGITTRFVYDGDGKRVKKTVNDSHGVATMIYVEDLYEKETLQ
ncbi:MAG: hypothetical protein HQL23_03125 [Candidatus Omnitrophica bacterium]|nr:hypothetical protein [Candidatus Omnitrophota bacterium]